MSRASRAKQLVWLARRLAQLRWVLPIVTAPTNQPIGVGQTGPMTSWVRVRAPVRVLDAGGWTDTWFAGGGTVCHLAVDDGADVAARRCTPGDSGNIGTVDLRLPTFAD